MSRCSKRALLAALFWACMLVPALAAPFAKRIQFRQPDGTVVELWGEGDEFHAVFETLDGYAVVFEPIASAYVYASLAADGNALVPTALLVGAGDPRTLGLPTHLRLNPAAAAALATARRARWEQGVEVSSRWAALKALRRAQDAAAGLGDPALAPPSSTTTGAKTGLCLLIDFDDDPATIPQASIVGFCNGDAYADYGNNGSVKQYFLDNSDGLLTYTSVVTAYIRIPNSLHPKSYYNDTSKDAGAQANLLIRDAIAIMRALPNYTSTILPTFSSLTVDGSNNVVACNVFYAGGNGGVWSKGLWPHSWSLHNVGAQELSAGGKKVFRYQVTDIGGSLELGTFCHENGHMLCGFPDLYDYTVPTDSVGGAGMFCLMGYGGQGSNPVQSCAYLKRAAGWATVTELSSASALTASLTASAGASFNHFYRYQKPAVATEYYLLENRQQTGRDADLPAAGIAVWHIDELGNRDNQSLVPNSTHANYECTLVQADNLWHFQNYINAGDAQDLYYLGNSATAYTNQLHDGTSPHAHWWDGSRSALDIHDISASGDTMTFGVGLPAPVLQAEPPYTQGITNTIAWSAVSGAEHYYAEADDSGSGFPSPDQNSGWVSGTSHAFSGLGPTSTQHYRVKTRKTTPGTLDTWSQSTQAQFLTDTLANTTAGSGSGVQLTSSSTPATDTVGSASSWYLPTAPRTRFAVYQCTSSATLTRIEAYLAVSSSTSVEFSVYEATTLEGTYTRIHSNTVTAAAATGFLSSGDVAVPLVSGRYYAIATGWNAAVVTQYLSVLGASTPTPVSWGNCILGNVLSAYPAPAAFLGTGLAANVLRLYQRLTTGLPSYAASGAVTTASLNPAPFDRWGALSYVRTTPAGTALTVDILDNSNAVLAANVASGANLAALIGSARPIKLRANLSTSNSATTPALSSWAVSWQGVASYVESAWSNLESSTQDPQSAAIGDLVWHDYDGDGVVDGGEPGIQGVTVRLYQDDGDSVFEGGGQDALVETKTTDVSGAYTCTGLFPGTYWVDVDQTSAPLSGFLPTTANDPLQVVLSSGQNYNVADFGYRQYALTVSVAPDGAGTATPSVGVHRYGSGTVVSIDATPVGAYEFDQWTGTAVAAGKVAAPASASTTVTMDGDYTLIASFSATTVTSVTPSGVDLVAASDTGVSDTDDLTRLNNGSAGTRLSFDVSGTVAGATVRVYAEGTEIGNAVAGGATTTVLTDGATPLAAGAHTITATQTEPGKDPSPASPTLTVTLDLTAPTLLSAVSRKAHGAAGAFDLVLPIASPWGVECRMATVTALSLVFGFSEAVHEGAGFAATVTSGTATPGASELSSNTLTLALSGVADSQWLALRLNPIEDPAGNALDLAYTLGILAGDVTLNGTVNAQDILFVRYNSLQPLDQATNFRYDINASGATNAQDVLFVRYYSLHALPPP